MPPPTWVKQAQAANPGSSQSKFPPQPSECNDKTLSTCIVYLFEESTYSAATST
ncbi:hypothetical protein PISMIDRAFT_16148 [Pisolithus microcarpus 441]|uniref:Uncharacterized protein n=1 Tax=Pisolithus microcarpus 441 TaxID=765257 RepID=A0A0C9Z117_9AGAM|nr:hypothetical protein PISMIDRAFT_16148 [Pisolithus microcarpus 441]